MSNELLIWYGLDTPGIKLSTQNIVLRFYGDVLSVCSRALAAKRNAVETSLALQCDIDRFAFYYASHTRIRDDRPVRCNNV